MAKAPPTDTTHGMEVRLGRWIIPVGVLVMVLAAAAVVAAMVNLRRDALADARVAASNLATVLASQASKSVLSADNSMREIRARIAELAANSPLPMKELLGTREVFSLLATAADRLPQVQTLSVVSADGLLVNTSRSWPFRRISLSDRDYVRHMESTDDEALFVARPVANRADGAWTLYLARRLWAGDGRFAGLVLAGMPLAHLDDVLKGVALPPGGSFTLLRHDGMRLVRVPNGEKLIGTMVEAGSPWYATVAAGGGSFHLDSEADMGSRMVVAQLVGDYPLVVNIGIEEAAILARWWQQATVIAGITGALMLVSTLLLVHLRRLVLRQEAARQTLVRANAELTDATTRVEASQKRQAAQSAVLETILNSMDQGLIMIDANRRVAVCNRRAREMLDLPADLMARQPTFEELLEYQWRQGEFNRTDMELQTFIRNAALLDGPPVYDRRRPDGQVIEVRTVPQPGGGVVRTYTDITMRRDAEDRIRHAAHHDDLTKLANRAAFNERLTEAIAIAARDGSRVGLLYLDLDHFKQINDTSGHHAGDALLTEAAKRMVDVTREGDTVARMGGDEFAVIQPNAVRPDGTTALAHRLLAAVRRPYRVGGRQAEVGVSVGIAWYPDDGQDPDTLLRHADAALYAAKNAGRNAVRCYQADQAPAPVHAEGADD